jgi:acetyl-CoA carboxylase carboxyltransferase component
VLTGLADQMAEDEFDAIRKARDWVASLQAPASNGFLTMPALPPRYDADDLLFFINPDIRKALDIREILIRVGDDSRVMEFKPEGSWSSSPKGHGVQARIWSQLDHCFGVNLWYTDA